MNYFMRNPQGCCLIVIFCNLKINRQLKWWIFAGELIPWKQMQFILLAAVFRFERKSFHRFVVEMNEYGGGLQWTTLERGETPDLRHLLASGLYLDSYETAISIDQDSVNISVPNRFDHARRNITHTERNDTTG